MMMIMVLSLTAAILLRFMIYILHVDDGKKDISYTNTCFFSSFFSLSLERFFRGLISSWMKSLQETRVIEGGFDR